MKKIYLLLASTLLLISCSNGESSDTSTTNTGTTSDTTATSDTSTDPKITITNLLLSGNYPTVFYKNETFSYTGLEVSAEYSDSTVSKVENFTVTADLSVTGIKEATVSVTYLENVYTTTYRINVIDKANIYSDPYLAKQYYLDQMGDIFSIWQKYRGKGVTVAVIDSAFDAYHEDFTFSNGVSKVLPTSASFEYNGSEVITKVGIEHAHDKQGDPHGTFCAGVVGAGTNAKGVVGIAPDCNLMLLKTDKKPKSICEAFKYAADNGAKVITISIGSYYDYEGDLVNDGSNLSTVFDESISYARNKGVVICSAGGNGGGSPRATEYTYPGSCKYVVGCGGLAFNEDGKIWSGSSYNSSSTYQFIDVFAQSDKMFGCTNHYEGGTYYTYDGDWEGTSFASPIVAGVAALYFEKYPNNSVQQFETALFNNCMKVTSDDPGLSMSNFGYGRINASKTLSEENTSPITIRVKANSSVKMYAWNFEQTKEIAEWPGVDMNYSSNIYSYTLSLKDYQNVIFSVGSSQTINIEAGSFVDNPIYDLTSPTYENSKMVGVYK